MAMEKLQVTLKALRAAGACISGYNKLVCALTGKEFDEERETYIRYQYDEPISIEYILDSNGLDDALWSLRAVPNAERDCRHYALWCARQVQHLMTDKRSIAALDVAERHADGLATDDELAAARAAALDAARAAAWDAAPDVARDAAQAAAWAVAQDTACAAARAAAQDTQADMLRLMCRGKAPWQR